LAAISNDLQALDEFAGAHEQHAPSVLDESNPDGCYEMDLAVAILRRRIARYPAWNSTTRPEFQGWERSSA